MIKRDSKLYLYNSDIEKFTSKIIHDMVAEDYKPEIIVAPARGGLVVGTMLSHYFNVPFYGINKPLQGFYEHPLEKYKKTLVVDDINDRGKTFSYIEVIYSKFFPENQRRYAAVVENLSSSFDGVDYYGTEINKAEEDLWVVFPWEDWFSRSL